MRIDRTSNAPRTAATPVTPARVTAASSAQQSFTEMADDTALALQIEEQVTGGPAGREDAKKKTVLKPIDDIAARASLNIVQRKL
jgi:hypothetical protein